MNIIFKTIEYDSTHYHEAILLREVILRIPIGLAFTPDEFIEEPNYIHIVGLVDNKVIATAMLVLEEKACKMRQVAIHADYQNQGVGSQLLQFCEEEVLRLNRHEVYCHARKTAMAFYLKNHYFLEGDYFIEATIPHIKMHKNLRGK